MALIVQKYGGTSVGSLNKIQNVAKKVMATQGQGNQVIVVVSAMSGETSRLLAIADKINYKLPHLSIAQKQEIDTLIATGEQVTIALLSMQIIALGGKAISYTGWQVPIKTDNSHNKSRIKSIKKKNLLNNLKQGKIAVVAGFQGVSSQDRITTLGRGGSDTTAVAIAATVKADECQIFTDVDGVYTTDPKIEEKAKKISILSYEEMLEMASLGSKILQIRSVEFANKYKVNLRVLSSFAKSSTGTMITSEDNIKQYYKKKNEINKEKKMERAIISGIAHQKDEAKFTLIAIPDIPGIAYKILHPISVANIEVDMIVQSAAKQNNNKNTTNFSFTTHRNDFSKIKDIMQQLKQDLNAESMVADKSIAKISLVGIGMRSHAGIASQMFACLSKENINIQMISTSEIKISVIIDEKYTELAVRTLHKEFKLDK